MKHNLNIEKIRELETITKELDTEKLRLSAVSKSVCDHNWKEWEDESCNAQMRCTKCKTVKRIVR